MGIYDQVLHNTASTVALKYGLPEESVSLIIPSLVIYKRCIEEFGGETVWMPGLELNDGNAYDFARKNGIIRSGIISMRISWPRPGTWQSAISAAKAISVFWRTRPWPFLTVRRRSMALGPGSACFCRSR